MSDFNYFTVGFSKKYVKTKCFCIVKKDGTEVDFSIMNCVKSAIKKKPSQPAISSRLRCVAETLHTGGQTSISPGCDSVGNCGRRFPSCFSKNRVGLWHFSSLLQCVFFKHVANTTWTSKSWQKF